MAGSFDRYGHLMACPKAACSDSRIRQVLANNFGVSLLRPLWSADLPSPKQAESRVNVSINTHNWSRYVTVTTRDIRMYCGRFVGP